MNMMTLLTVARTLTALLMLSPAIACAQPVDQEHSQSEAKTSAKGVSLQAFIERREKRQLALDTDGDGKVSRSEYLAGAKAGKTDPAKRFARLDRDGSGMLDKSEIDAMLSRRFKRLDANGDGVASPTERAGARPKSIDAAGDETES
ncbi:EF-hand domain-containing protein [Sphingomonas sp. PAMC 26621]|uniref:EF-hand domain-containing protein n=1 Tax=Sphingomonas sp. PAMC 26621 TaxID=1112213 RepID=UPI000288A82A|nr:signal transduction protein [Sphingomonas sp. PAMC 26621]